jgi:hypothetical protein
LLLLLLLLLPLLPLLLPLDCALLLLLPNFGVCSAGGSSAT